MNITVTHTASEARDNLYSIIKSASEGLYTHEIHLRGTKPVVLVSKEDLESWLETIDILSNPEEVAAIKAGTKASIKNGIPFNQVIKELGLANEIDPPSRGK